MKMPGRISSSSGKLIATTAFCALACAAAFGAGERTLSEDGKILTFDIPSGTVTDAGSVKVYEVLDAEGKGLESPLWPSADDQE